MLSVNLEGELALITGGGTGIGYAIASAFVDAGASVVIVGRRADVLGDAAERLGPKVIAITHDVTDLDSAEALFVSIKTATGRAPSILVNNAGQHMRGKLTESGVEQVDALFRIHVLAAMRLTELALKDMTIKKHGNILFVSSMSAYMGLQNVPGYSIAKSAIEGAVRQLAVEYGAEGIRVNAIAPGWITTEMFEESMKGTDRRTRILGRTPLGRFGQTSEVGNTAAFLVSPLASFITGSSLRVDGGVAISF